MKRNSFATVLMIGVFLISFGSLAQGGPYTSLIATEFAVVIAEGDRVPEPEEDVGKIAETKILRSLSGRTTITIGPPDRGMGVTNPSSSAAADGPVSACIGGVCPLNNHSSVSATTQNRSTVRVGVRRWQWRRRN